MTDVLLWVIGFLALGAILAPATVVAQRGASHRRTRQAPPHDRDQAASPDDPSR